MLALMPAPVDETRWEKLADGSYRRRRPDAVAVATQEPDPEDLGVESLGAAHPPEMVEQIESEQQDADATEAAAELADELGVDLATVEGTGKDGRITKADVEAAAE
jgi:pyruvate/2-oxoglutarate dehydrogenase complex dihydrolipoamide acyltransferase (E2) component